MAGLTFGTKTGELICLGNSSAPYPISMHCPAWCVLNALPLWVPMDTRGASLVVPGALGQRPSPLRIDESEHALEMALTGVADRDGVFQNDEWEGLQDNIDFLMTYVVTPPALPAKTRPWSLGMPDGSTRTADVQVLRLEIGSNVMSVVRAILHLRIPAGRFA